MSPTKRASKSSAWSSAVPHRIETYVLLTTKQDEGPEEYRAYAAASFANGGRTTHPNQAKTIVHCRRATTLIPTFRARPFRESTAS